MALGGLFAKKKDIQPPGPAPSVGMNPTGSESPVDMVKRMQAQGMNNQQIIQGLQREGFSQTQIYDALDTASQMQKQGGAAPGAQGNQPPGPPNGPPPGPPGPQAGPGGLPPPGGSPGGLPPPGNMPPRGQSHRAPAQMEQVDELIEKTVQEKWHEFTGELKQLEEFKGSVESRLASAEAKLDALDQKFDQLKNAIIAKIKDYDTSILNVGTEMKAMEQVFQKILPELHENVTELSRMTHKLGGGKKPAPKK